MVTITKYDEINLRLEAEDTDYFDIMRAEFTRAVPNFQFTPAYRSGRWNGRVCMINRWKQTFPYGILTDIIRIHRKNYPKVPIRVDQEVKDIFKGQDIEINYDLPTHDVRPYQDDCIRACLKHTKGIIISATASGKSLVIAYIIRHLIQNSIIQKCVIIVPRTSLIIQFYQDLVDYGFDSKKLGAVYSEKKQWDKEIVISTWQTLANNHDKLKIFDCIIADETHGAQAHEMKKILEKATTAKYRFGFTGTMHSAELDNWNTKSYIGPVIREYPAGLLADQGYISKCIINMLNIEYNEDVWHGDYHDIRETVFNNNFRLNLLKKLTKELDHNVLLLVDRVEKEGELLKQFLSKDVNKEVVFLSGRDNVDVREKWRKACMKRNDIALIATYGIFQLGINIPNLKYIILCTPFKAKIRVLQSIGRALRKHTNKKDGAQIFDIHDHTKFLEKHGNVRLRHYYNEKFEVQEYVFHEGDNITSSDFPFLFPSSE